MNYATSPNNSYSSADAFQAPLVVQVEPDDILRGVTAPESDMRNVILFHLLAVDERDEEHWVQNEFAFDIEDDLEYRRTLKELNSLEKEGTVRNMKVIRRTTQQEWLY